MGRSIKQKISLQLIVLILNSRMSLLSNVISMQLQPINDLDFHPQSSILISGAKDHTIKYGFFFSLR